MTDKMRRILSCILICISIIVIFAGCKNNEKDTVATDISKDTSATTQNVDDKTTGTTTAPNESTGTTTADSENKTSTTKKAVNKTTTKKANNKSTTSSKKSTGKTTTYEYTTVTVPNVGENCIADVIEENAVAIFNKKTGEFKIDCHGNFLTMFALKGFGGDDVYYTTNELNGEKIDEKGVKSIYFKDGVTVIGDTPTRYFVNATEVTIPKSTKRILRGTFPSSMKIKTINYGGTKEDWKKLLIDNGGNEAIQNCKSINYNVKIEKSTVSASTNYKFNQRYKTESYEYNYGTKTAAITRKLDYYTGVVTVSGKGPTDDIHEYPPIVSISMEYPSDWPDGRNFPLINTVKYEEGITVISEFDCIGSPAYTVYIPKSVKTIEAEAFSDNDYLKDVYYAGTEKEWKQIKIAKTNNEDLLNATIHFG